MFILESQWVKTSQYSKFVDPDWEKKLKDKQRLLWQQKFDPNAKHPSPVQPKSTSPELKISYHPIVDEMKQNPQQAYTDYLKTSKFHDIIGKEDIHLVTIYGDLKMRLEYDVYSLHIVVFNKAETAYSLMRNYRLSPVMAVSSVLERIEKAVELMTTELRNKTYFGMITANSNQKIKEAQYTKFVDPDWEKKLKEKQRSLWQVQFDGQKPKRPNTEPTPSAPSTSKVDSKFHPVLIEMQNHRQLDYVEFLKTTQYETDLFQGLEVAQLTTPKWKVAIEMKQHQIHTVLYDEYDRDYVLGGQRIDYSYYVQDVLNIINEEIHQAKQELESGKVFGRGR